MPRSACKTKDEGLRISDEGNPRRECEVEKPGLWSFKAELRVLRAQQSDLGALGESAAKSSDKNIESTLKMFRERHETTFADDIARKTEGCDKAKYIAEGMKGKAMSSSKIRGD